jgi:hypothetical protein
MFGTQNNEFTIKIRSAWRAMEEPITGMTNVWDFDITGSGEPSPCEEALVSKESQTQDFILSFGDVANIDPWMVPPQPVIIERAIETTSATKACSDKAKFRLEMWDKLANSGSGEYVDFEDLKAEFKAEVTHQFASYIHFENGNFDSLWFYQDIAALLDTRFTDANGNVAMKFRILVVMPGSTYHGPGIPKEELVQAEFKIKLVKDADVVTCENNKLIQDDETELTDERRESSQITLQITDKDAADAVVRVPAKRVSSLISGCALETVAEYYNP